jgi:glucokinase
VLRETADFLAIWAGNVIDLLEPDVFIFGGGVAQLMSGFFGRIREQLANWCVNKRFAEMPMALAKYGSDAGIAGAAALCHILPLPLNAVRPALHPLDSGQRSG